MPYQTGIRLLCVAQNPANGFPARPLVVAAAVTASLWILFTQAVDQPDEATAKYMPRRTIAYFSINLRPGMDQIKKARNVAEILDIEELQTDWEDAQDELEERTDINAEEDIPFRVLAANNTPDFRTVSDFRKDHLPALSGLFLQVLTLCQRAGLVKLGHVALDGTKVKANASKHKAMSYRRMKEKEAQLEGEVAELLRRAREVDEEEDRRYGPDKRGDELPEELSFREGRLRKIREAKAALEAEAREAAESEGRKHPGVPDDKAQRNFTDSESGIMPGPGGRDFQQAYNCQAVVDDAHQVIVAAQATNQASDKQQGVPMMEQAIANAGAVPKEVSADAGYYSARAVDEIYALGVDPFIAPERTRHGNVPPPVPLGRIPANLSARDRMRRKLRTKRGRERYRVRKETVEPVFGQIKQGRGFRQLLLRSLEKVNGEWSLICTGHNLLKLFRSRGKLPDRGTSICNGNLALVIAAVPLAMLAAPWHLMPMASLLPPPIRNRIFAI